MAESIERDPLRYISAANWLEAQMVMQGRLGSQGGFMLDAFFRELRVELVPLDAAHVHTALGAWRRFGKGLHAANLNLGDCCAYATAVLKKQPLLFKGSDFPATDIPRVAY